MVGTRSDPGLMVLSLNTIFDMIKSDKSSDDFEVTCSYLEVYNEVSLPLINLLLLLRPFFCVCGDLSVMRVTLSHIIICFNCNSGYIRSA